MARWLVCQRWNSKYLESIPCISHLGALYGISNLLQLKPRYRDFEISLAWFGVTGSAIDPLMTHKLLDSHQVHPLVK